MTDLAVLPPLEAEYGDPGLPHCRCHRRFLMALSFPPRTVFRKKPGDHRCRPSLRDDWQHRAARAAKRVATA